MKKRTILLIGKYKKVESDIARYKRNFFVLAIDNLLGIKSLKKNDLEKIDEGEQFLKKALTIYPTSPLALNNLGNILTKKNNNMDAEIC